MPLGAGSADKKRVLWVLGVGEQSGCGAPACEAGDSALNSAERLSLSPCLGPPVGGGNNRRVGGLQCEEEAAGERVCGSSHGRASRCQLVWRHLPWHVTVTACVPLGALHRVAVVPLDRRRPLGSGLLTPSGLSASRTWDRAVSIRPLNGGLVPRAVKSLSPQGADVAPEGEHRDQT